MKTITKRILITVVILFFAGLIFLFVNAFTGNPISAAIATDKIRDYAAVTYPTYNLELSEVKYGFPNSEYFCRAQSKSSADTTFQIAYSCGHVSDDYEYEVANHFTTYRRLSKNFDELVTGIIDKEYPHQTTLIIGDLVGETEQLTLDAPLDLNYMPLELSLTVDILSDIRNNEQMAALLLELHQLMLSKNIAIDQYTLRLEEPLPEEQKPGSGDNMYLTDFSSTAITADKQSLISAIKASQLAAEKNEKQ